jgi:predicted transcriptional regulator
MKTLSIKLDDYIFELLNKEAKEKKVTRMEIIRSAILNFLLNKDDAEDLAYIQSHKNDRLLTFDETFK